MTLLYLGLGTLIAAAAGLLLYVVLVEPIDRKAGHRPADAAALNSYGIFG